MAENKAATKKIAQNSKRSATPASFKSGQSGNPGGRPKKTPEEFELIAACKAKTPAALAVMESIMNSGENERNRLAAATAIIDRAYGKPTQAIDQDIKVGGTLVSLLESLSANPASRIKIGKS